MPSSGLALRAVALFHCAMKGFPDLPPLWLLLFMVLAWLMARFMPLYEGEVLALVVTGLTIAGLGFTLIFWSAVWFWRKRTTIEPHHKPSTLIVEGPYKLSRNPIYLGMLLILAGQVIWQGALSPAILPPILLFILTERFARPEEAGIIETFGEDGRAYLAATRRWV